MLSTTQQTPSPSSPFSDHHAPLLRPPATSASATSTATTTTRTHTPHLQQVNNAPFPRSFPAHLLTDSPTPYLRQPVRLPTRLAQFILLLQLLILLLSCALPAAAFSELRGVTLRACVLLEKPYVIRDAKRRSGYSGLALDYFQRLSDNLEFNVDYHHWNRTWSAFIDTMSRCDGQAGRRGRSSSPCPCDIGVGSFTMTNARASMINFVWPFASEAHQMVTRRSAMRVDDSKNAWFVFRIFPLQVWAALCAIVVLHAVGTLFFTPAFNLFSADKERKERTKSNAAAARARAAVVAARGKGSNVILLQQQQRSSASLDITEPTSNASFPSTESSSLPPTTFEFHDATKLEYILKQKYQEQQQQQQQERLPPLSVTQRILKACYYFPYALLFAYAHLLGEPLCTRSEDEDEEEASANPSVHRYAWIILGMTCGVFTLTVYEAGLTVLLFESEKTSPFDSLADITECRIAPSRIAMIRGGASQDFWNSAVNTSTNRAKCDWVSGATGLTVANLEDGFSTLRRGDADLFYSLEGSVRFRANGDCEKFEPVGDPFFSTSVAFVMPRRVNQTILQLLNKETRILIEQNEFPPASVIATRSECKPEIDPVIRVGKLSAFFSMYICCWFLLLSFRLLFLRSKRIRRKRQAQRTNVEREKAAEQSDAEVEEESV